MNNYCRNCGQSLGKDVTVCPKCGCEVINYSLNNDKKKNEYNKKEMRYIMSPIVLIVFAKIINIIEIPSKFSIYLACMVPVIYCLAIIIVVFARVKMKESKKIKLLFNIIVYAALIWIAFSILVTLACFIGYNFGN